MHSSSSPLDAAAMTTTTAARDRRAGAARRSTSTLVFGGPPECQERPLCLGDKEQQLYGLEFKEVKKLDTGGPSRSKALKDGTIQVGTPVHRQQRDRPRLRAARRTTRVCSRPTTRPRSSTRTKATDDVVAILDAVNESSRSTSTTRWRSRCSTTRKTRRTSPATFLKRAGLEPRATTGDGTQADRRLEGLRRRAAAEPGVRRRRSTANGYDITLQGQHRPDGDRVSRS